MPSDASTDNNSTSLDTSSSKRGHFPPSVSIKPQTYKNIPSQFTNTNLKPPQIPLRINNYPPAYLNNKINHLNMLDYNNADVTVKEVISFIDSVKETYKDSPSIYDSFLESMRDYKTRRIDAYSRRVSGGLVIEKS